MKEPGNDIRFVLLGAVAGLAGGGVIYLGLGQDELAREIAVGPHFAASAVIGAGFALLVGPPTRSAGYGIMWGMAYALMLWVLGPLTLVPLARGRQPDWSITSVQFGFQLLPAYLVGYGIIMSLVYRCLLTAWSLAERPRLTRSSALRLLRVVIIGGIAGYVGGRVFSAWLGASGDFPLFAALVQSRSTATGRLIYSLGSVFLGAMYGVLYGRDIRGAGSSMAWGVTYGYLWWLLGELTILTSWLGQGVDWSLDNARSAFPGLVGHMIWGLLLGMLYALLDRVWRELFTERLPWDREPEGPGTRGLRALGMGLLAGAVGGAAYAATLSGRDGLTMLARLAASTSPVAGTVVAVIAGALLGALYGVLFRRESFTYGSALVWGMVYGIVLWFLGRLWLLPALLGLPLPWDLPQVLEAYPWLAAQLLYGVVMALVYQYLANRHDVGLRLLGPQYTRRHEDAATPTPALWVVVIVLTVLLPLVLAGR